MDLPPDSVIEERLTNAFPNTRLRELARATGLIQREGGELEADALFWALAIGFLSSNYRTLEEFRQEYIDTYGGSLSYASFHEWFTPALCEFLREVLKHAVLNRQRAMGWRQTYSIYFAFCAQFCGTIFLFHRTFGYFALG
jgi:hypothetical protein